MVLSPMVAGGGSSTLILRSDLWANSDLPLPHGLAPSKTMVSQSPSEHRQPYAWRILRVWSAFFWIWSRRPRAQGIGVDSSFLLNLKCLIRSYFSACREVQEQDRIKNIRSDLKNKSAGASPRFIYQRGGASVPWPFLAKSSRCFLPILASSSGFLAGFNHGHAGILWQD